MNAPCDFPEPNEDSKSLSHSCFTHTRSSQKGAPSQWFDLIFESNTRWAEGSVPAIRLSSIGQLGAFETLSFCFEQPYPGYNQLKQAGCMELFSYWLSNAAHGATNWTMWADSEAYDIESFR